MSGALEFGPSLRAELGSDLVWTSEDEGLAESLNSISELLMGEYSPADGPPQGYLVSTLAEMLEATGSELHPPEPIETEEESILLDESEKIY